MMKQKRGTRRFEEVGEHQYSFVSHSKESGFILKCGREMALNRAAIFAVMENGLERDMREMEKSLRSL